MRLRARGDLPREAGKKITWSDGAGHIVRLIGLKQLPDFPPVEPSTFCAGSQGAVSKS